MRWPVHYGEQEKKLRKAFAVLWKKGDYSPTLEELAKVSGISLKKLNEMQEIGQTDDNRMLSLDAPVAHEWEGGGERLVDSIPDTHQSTPEDVAFASMSKDMLNEMLQKLTPQERDILELRYGLADGQLQTLEAVGKKYGVSRERIRQIEVKALKKLRGGRGYAKFKAALL